MDWWGSSRHRRYRGHRTVAAASTGYGGKLDPKALKALPPGSFHTEPGGEAHVAQTQVEAVVVFITGYGPSSMDYVEPRRTATP